MNVPEFSHFNSEVFSWIFKLSKELTVSEKQDYLVGFGYDPTNVKYMNTEILDQAYSSALKIRDAEAGGETITAIGTGLPSEG